MQCRGGEDRSWKGGEQERKKGRKKGANLEAERGSRRGVKGWVFEVPFYFETVKE